jgi:hypothetical protein
MLPNKKTRFLMRFLISIKTYHLDQHKNKSAASAIPVCNLLLVSIRPNAIQGTRGSDGLSKTDCF